MEGKSDNKTQHKVSGEICCLPLEEGGLGIRGLEEHMQVAHLRLVWDIVTRRPSVWGEWVQEVLLKK